MVRAIDLGAWTLLDIAMIAGLLLAFGILYGFSYACTRL